MEVSINDTNKISQFDPDVNFLKKNLLKKN